MSGYKEIYTRYPRQNEIIIFARIQSNIEYRIKKAKTIVQILINFTLNRRFQISFHSPSTSVKIIVPASVPVGLAVVVSVILPMLVSQMMSLL